VTFFLLWSYFRVFYRSKTEQRGIQYKWGRC